MILQLLLAALLAGSLVSALLPVLRGRRLARESEAWPRVRGQIIEAEAPNTRPFGLPRVEYEYKVDGLLYHGTAIAFGLPEKTREPLMVRYQPGDVVWVHVQPGHPEHAVLYPGGSALRKLLGDWPALLNLVFSGALSVLFVVLLLRDVLH